MCATPSEEYGPGAPVTGCLWAAELLLPEYRHHPDRSSGNEWGSELTASTVLSMEQSRRTAGAVCACIEEQGYATGLVALAVLAEQCSPQRDNARLPAHPLLQSMRVTTEGLCRHRAVRNEFPFTDRVEGTLDPHIDTLRGVALGQRAGTGARNQATPAPRPRHGDVLFDIVRVKEWSDPREWRTSRVSWLARGGQWAYWGMNRSGRILLCRIAAACISHTEPERVSFTMKLGRHLGFSALLSDKSEPLDLCVAEILRDTGALPSGREGNRDGLSAMYLQFSHALASLCEADVLADVVWPAADRFPAVHENGEGPDGWMESRIRLAPAVIPTHPVEWAAPGRLEFLKT